MWSYARGVEDFKISLADAGMPWTPKPHRCMGASSRPSIYRSTRPAHAVLHWPPRRACGFRVKPRSFRASLKASFQKISVMGSPCAVWSNMASCCYAPATLRACQGVPLYRREFGRGEVFGEKELTLELLLASLSHATWHRSIAIYGPF